MKIPKKHDSRPGALIHGFLLKYESNDPSSLAHSHSHPVWGGWGVWEGYLPAGLQSEE